MVRAGQLSFTMLAMPLAAFVSTTAPTPSSLMSDQVFAHVSLEPKSNEEDVERALARIREVTEPFHDIAAAHDAGYPTEVPDCVESPEGGMGHHYAHPELLDDTLEVEKPEILVYAPTKDGDLKLAGVEYIVPYSARSRDEAPPRILGQDLKRADSLELWYLHVWVWEKNPKGLFADWNPVVKCSP